ncbi:MAG: hypothetical protein IT466_08785 [Moraxellaceae bacterium]|nr:hypothetical protein [Moraxellaceae bacterium]
MTDTPKTHNANTAPKGASVVDWEKIESLYRAGVKSTREIAVDMGVSHTAINKRAKNESWDRDLSAKVRAKADAKVSKAMVSSEVSTVSKVTEKLIIEVEAEIQSRIRLDHRKDIGRSRTLAMRLLEELEQQTAQVPELAALGQLMYSPDDKGVDKLNELYQKIISLPGRTKTMTDLSNTLKTLIGLERQAFGLDTAPPSANDPFTAMLNRISQSNSSAFRPVQDDPDHDED